MNKKIYVIIIVLILCCGCNAKYSLNLNDNLISEKLNVSYVRNNESDMELDQIYTNYLYAIGRDSFYKFDNLGSTKETINLNFSYDYSTSDITSSNLIRSCIEHFDFFEEDSKYYLIASGSLRCNYYEYVQLSSLDITLTTNHNVLENNADEVNDDEYIWHIDLNKNDNVNIKFITDDKISKVIKKREYKQIIFIAGIGLSVLGLIALIVFIRYKRVNKI